MERIWHEKLKFALKFQCMMFACHRFVLYRYVRLLAPCVARCLVNFIHNVCFATIKCVKLSLDDFHEFRKVNKCCKVVSSSLTAALVTPHVGGLCMQ